MLVYILMFVYMYHDYILYIWYTLPFLELYGLFIVLQFNMQDFKRCYILCVCVGGGGGGGGGGLSSRFVIVC